LAPTTKFDDLVAEAKDIQPGSEPLPAIPDRRAYPLPGSIGARCLGRPDCPSQPRPSDPRSA
jgi:hypothetical protein